MILKLPATHLEAPAVVPCCIISRKSKHGYVSGTVSFKQLRLKLVGQAPGDKWKPNDIDTKAVQERINSWLSKTQTFLNEVTSPLVKNPPDGKLDPRNEFDSQEVENLFVAERTLHCHTNNGVLSPAAIVSIEQFSRMNGLTGQKMQNIFKALVPEKVYNDARNLVEYCCFRFLARDAADLHHCLKEPAFQRLIFITMIAWDNPYAEEISWQVQRSEKAYFQGKLVGEEAFVRIAPAVSGVADRPTVHSLFKALAGEKQGISLTVWLTYIGELLKIHDGRKAYRASEHLQLSEERILCIASGRKQPVLKWENNIAWPGKLTLTDKALYFEPLGLLRPKQAISLALTGEGAKVEKAKVGPFGSVPFDSAVSVSSGPGSEAWVLEFVDLGGELRRDVWHAFISEVITLHKFLFDYGPPDDDQSLFQVFGSHKGRERATICAINGITRLQALQFMHKVLDDPIKLVQFSYLQNAPFGGVVCQTLAVSFWGGPLVTKVTDPGYQHAEAVKNSEQIYDGTNHVSDIDGSVYLKKWMKSPSWASNASISFWNNSSARQGVVLRKNLIVADMTLVERAAATCRQKCLVVEKTQATIDAATLTGIPINIDLFKELLLPLTMVANSFGKLRRWEEPRLTLSFLAFAYTIMFRNLLPYVFPVALMVLAAVMLTLKGLKEQGRLGRSFGKVTIHDQPPSNTIQKIIAVKEAMQDMENYLQNLNVALLKVRAIVLAGQPQITTEVALVLLASAALLLIVPFKYILAFLLFDLFTRELELRREMVKRFASLLKERWATVPAAPVLVLPFEANETKTANGKETEERALGMEANNRPR